MQFISCRLPPPSSPPPPPFPLSPSTLPSPTHHLPSFPPLHPTHWFIDPRCLWTRSKCPTAVLYLSPVAVVRRKEKLMRLFTAHWLQRWQDGKVWEGKNGEGAGLIWVTDCSDLMALLCRRDTEMAFVAQEGHVALLFRTSGMVLLHRRAMWPCCSGPLRWSCYTGGPCGLVEEKGDWS